MVTKCLRNGGEIFAKWWRRFLRNICEMVAKFFAKYLRNGGEVFAKCLVNVCEIFADVILACPRSRGVFPKLTKNLLIPRP